MLKKLLFGFIILSSINFCLAAEVEGADLELKAKQAFQNDDYQQALIYFEEIIDKGNDQFSTRYNLAVSYFKAGQFQSAKDQFLDLIEDGFGAPRVVYSLAVAEKRLNNIAQAIRYFSLVEKSDSSLSGNASQQLAQLNAQPLTSRQSSNRDVSGEIGISHGYNDAIIDIKDNVVLREGDTYSELLGTVSWKNFLPGLRGIDFTGLVYSSRHSTFREQDFSLISLGLIKKVAVSQGSFFGQVELEKSGLGGSGYMQNSMLSLGFQNSNRINAWQIKARYKYSNSSKRVYEPYAGDEIRIEAAYSMRLMSNKHRFTLRAFTEEISRPSVEYSSYTQDLSKARSRLSFSWRTQFSRGIAVDAEVNFTESRVDAYRQYADGNTSRRRESAFAYYVEVQKKLFESWVLTASYSAKENDSNHVNYEYEQGIFKLGISVKIN